jgi:hypothetical protein
LKLCFDDFQEKQEEEEKNLQQQKELLEVLSSYKT